MRALVVGEAMVELRQVDQGLELAVAGDAYNFAAHLRERGWEVHHRQDLGDDILRPRLLADFDRRGIDWSGRVHADAANGLYMVATDARGERRFQYFRAGSAAGRTVDRDAVQEIADLAAGSDVVFVTGVTVAITGDQDALAAIAETASDRLTVGLNLREGLHWRRDDGALIPRGDELPGLVARLCERAAIVVGSRPELSQVGRGDPGAVARRWTTSRPGAVVAITAGAAGAEAWSRGAPARVRAAPAGAVVDTTGAGDAFAAAFVDGHLRGRDLVAALSVGAGAGAAAVSHRGALQSPTAVVDRRRAT